jgi:hypothetical protein
MNLEKGEEREIQDRQNSKLMEEYRHQAVREGEMRILADKNKREVQTKVAQYLYRSNLVDFTMRSNSSIIGLPRNCSKKISPTER